MRCGYPLSYGGVVESAPWHLIQALQPTQQMDDLSEGLYKDVQEPNKRELGLW